jgi:hypothetical protein
MRPSSVLRIMIGVAVLALGTMHLFSFPPLPPGGAPADALPALWIASVLAVFGGTAVLLDGVVSRCF